MLEGHDWYQPIHYEHIPFRCRRCHEHGNLFRDFPDNKPSNQQKLKDQKDEDGFTKVAGRKRTTK